LLNAVKILLSTALSVYVISNIFYSTEPLRARALFILLVLVLAALTVDAERLFKSVWGKLWAALLVVATVLAYGYVVVFNNEILKRVGIPNDTDIFFGVVAIVILMYFVQRSTGWAFTLIVGVAIAYVFLGKYIPIQYGGHGGYTLNRFMTMTYLSTNGIFGSVMYVMFQYVFLFVLFGKVLEYSGALNFIMKFSQAVVGWMRGGPALIATVSSMLVGSVSGSAAANVMITGSVSIPMMKKMGFSPHAAGGVEAAASTGGQIMPPVMGAVAFVMAQFLGVPYYDVVRAALIPAVLYFLSVAVGVYIYAVRSGIPAMKRSELPSLRDALKEPGMLTFVLGLGTLVYLLVIRYSAPLSAIAAMVVMLVVGSFRKETRINVRKLLNIFKETAENFIGVGIPAFAVGIIVGALLMTGLSIRFGQLVVDLAGGNLILLLIMTAVMVIILGMGLPTAIAYILAVMVAASALTSFGLLDMQVHMFILYLACLSMITPPVAMAAYAASVLAQTSFWKTGFFACLLCLPAFIIPFIFVFHEQLLMIGETQEILVAFVTAVIGVILIAYSTIGRLASKLSLVFRIAALAMGIILITPNLTLNLIVLAILAVSLGVYLIRRKMAKQQTA